MLPCRSERLGGNRPVTDDWSIRMGALFDQNPQPEEAAGPLLPDSDRFGVSMGLGWHRGRWIVDGGMLFLEFLERTTDESHDDFTGTYRTHANLWFLNVGTRF